MKFCKDCFYVDIPMRWDVITDRKREDIANACCSRTKTYDMVSGEPIMSFCSVERESLRPEACGKEGKHFARPDEREEWQRDEHQGVTNWDTGWNGVHAQEEGM